MDAASALHVRPAHRNILPEERQRAQGGNTHAGNRLAVRRRSQVGRRRRQEDLC